MKNQTSLLRWAGMFTLAFAVFVGLGHIAKATGGQNDDEVLRLSIAGEGGKLSLPSVLFNHDQHKEALEDDCLPCHDDGNGDFTEEYMRAGSLKGNADALKELYHTSCISCHEDAAAKNKAAGPLLADCRSCHNADAEAAFTAQGGGTPPARGSASGSGGALYNFLTGTGFYISLAVFVIGLAARFIMYFNGLDWKLDRVAYKPHMGDGMKGGVHSAFKWLLPFGTHGWRAQPLFTLIFFMFHLGAVLVPLFLIGHNEFLQTKFGFSLPTLGQTAADVLTVLTLVGAVCILARRLAVPSVRILTNGNDYFILILATLPFLTGFMARMSAAPAETWMLCHLITGELLLILAPFTKLSHIVLYFASRWQIGADYAIKRGGHRRGAFFPW